MMLYQKIDVKRDQVFKFCNIYEINPESNLAVTKT